jgi:hypothetical protein
MFVNASFTLYKPHLFFRLLYFLKNMINAINANPLVASSPIDMLKSALDDSYTYRIMSFCIDILSPLMTVFDPKRLEQWKEALVHLARSELDPFLDNIKMARSGGIQKDGDENRRIRFDDFYVTEYRDKSNPDQYSLRLIIDKGGNNIQHVQDLTHSSSISLEDVMNNITAALDIPFKIEASLLLPRLGVSAIIEAAIEDDGITSKMRIGQFTFIEGPNESGDTVVIVIDNNEVYNDGNPIQVEAPSLRAIKKNAAFEKQRVRTSKNLDTGDQKQQESDDEILFFETENSRDKRAQQWSAGLQNFQPPVNPDAPSLI